MEDFDFDLTLKTNSFRIKVPGSPTIKCDGTRMCDRAKKALARARSGQEISIFDLEVQNPKNPSYKFKRTSPVIVVIN